MDKDAFTLQGAGAGKCCWSRPHGQAQAILAAYRRGGLSALAPFRDASFIILDNEQQILGRGAYSGTAIYFLGAASPDKTSAASRVSTSLRVIGRQLGYRPDPIGVRDYLCYGFVPAPRTIFSGVSAVPPGTVCLIDGDRAQLHWARLPCSATPTTCDPIAEFSRQLNNSVQTGKATALLLSGGLDSAMIAAVSKEMGVTPAAYHARFAEADPERDEDTLLSRVAATHLRLPYQEVRIGSLQALQYFNRVISTLDQPFGDPVILPFYLLFRQIRGRHSLVITGEGGDQLFGSWSLKPMLLREAYSHPGYCRNLAYLESFHKFSEEWEMLLSPPLLDLLEDRPEQPIANAWAASPGSDFGDSIRWVDINLKGVQHILPRIEAMATAQDITLKHPFFEASMLELSFALPAELKFHGPQEKVLLKQLARHRLPSAVVERRKAGMGVPTTAWFRRGLRPLAWHLLGARRLSRSGLLNPAAVRAILKGELASGDGRARRWGDRLWLLCALESWFASLSGHGKKP